MELYKGYVLTDGKKSIEPLKNRKKFKTLEQVRDAKSYGGVLALNTILIDIDDENQAERLMNIVEDLQLNCKVLCTSRGKHFLFRNSRKMVTANRTHTTLAVGLTADIKLGIKTSYEVLKINGEERFCEWDVETGQDYDELPRWLLPVRTSADFINMEAGSGRNQALFNYILTLSAHDFDVEETRECIRLLNGYILKDPLDDDELNVILRDEAFQKPVFFVGNTFLFDKFAIWLKNHDHIFRINQQLHIYDDGVYVNGYRKIESDMIQTIPNLKRTQRREVLDYLELIADDLEPSDSRYIAFRNGIYNLDTDVLQTVSSDIVVTNRIPWDYNPDAYDELADKTLDKMADGDKQIRMLLEECIGACFYRSNTLGGGKSFFLTGDKSNGKSTYLKILKCILGRDNISALDLKELGDRFSTSMMFGKLANIGDDIGNDFLEGNQIAIFKKIVTGERLKAEKKGQDPFEFEPYVKLMFSANEIPRMKDKTGAVLRRMVIIPFNHVFSKNDPDYDVNIAFKLTSQEAMEYFIRIGIHALERVRVNQSFSESSAVTKQLDEFELENNPIIGFISESDPSHIENQPTAEVFKRYQCYCQENSMIPMSKGAFVKQINKRMGLSVNVVRIGNTTARVFVRR